MGLIGLIRRIGVARAGRRATRHLHASTRGCGVIRRVPEIVRLAGGLIVLRIVGYLVARIGLGWKLTEHQHGGHDEHQQQNGAGQRPFRPRRLRVRDGEQVHHTTWHSG